PPILQHGEGGFAEPPQSHDPAGEPAANLLPLQNLLGFLPMQANQLARSVRCVESRAIGLHPQFAQGVQLLNALLLLVVQIVHYFSIHPLLCKDGGGVVARAYSSWTLSSRNRSRSRRL